MDTSYKTVKTENHDEFVEKHSRFIGYCKPVATEQEAVDFINMIKKKHWDARHNCYAYSLRDSQIRRYSDDGEPSGTAGMPILDVITKSGIVDVVVVVTRYFGGILLGTGGLVRAYSQGCKLALESAGPVTMELCCECFIRCSYNRYGKLNTVIIDNGGAVDSVDYADDVKINFHIPSEKVAALDKIFADVTSGEIKTEISGEKFFEN
ncbi:MAG: YigZ family protein [Ruminococcus sp.]|nr:YigZ family protein [Ruminococcus sp.]